MTNLKTELEALIESKDLVGYGLMEDVDSGCGPNMRTYDKLKLVFPSGKTLTLVSFCSGSSECTSLLLDE